ncbi:uncharacterized protein LOC128395049 isoform X2 [Panonychus citri]|uniref:uncharacterized protein LOC128395049 isoform X2 n=1 Tax=Panonychus citri TaxID=50023 RepID=UPI002307CD63|nr:uncharacterized protein LOC128395049 isoform X2 [Panonychus citri]
MMDNYIGMTNLNGDGGVSDSNGPRSCRCCRRVGSLLCSNLGLSLLILGYSTLGAFIFSTLESMSERQRINQVITLRNQTVSKLWRITENTNILKEENWTAMTTNEIIKFQNLLYQAFREGYDGRETFNPQTDQWSFSGAFLYSLTVITTIGYGNIGPRTMEGKMLTIAYAILGIPLMILFLSKMGSMLANGLRCFYRTCCVCLPSGGGKGQLNGNLAHSSSGQGIGGDSGDGLGLGGGTLVTVDGGLGGITGLDQMLSGGGGMGVDGTGHLSSPTGLLSSHHHGNHSHHHLHDHYHVHHIALNDIHAANQGSGQGGTNPASGHVALHCNSTSRNGVNPNQTTGTLGIVCKGSGVGGGNNCYGTGGNGTCNAISISGSPGLVGGTNGLTLSPTVVSMGNSVGPLGIATITDSEQKICPETTQVPEHYTCQGILLNRHSHATLHTHPPSGHHHHHHPDHINATTLTTCTADLHNDYQQYSQQNDYQVNHQCCHHIHSQSNHNNHQSNQNHNQFSQQNGNDCSGQSGQYYYPKTVPITLCCIIIISYIFLGAAIFYLWEGGNFWESVYFCFASISTIGLGQATWILSDFRNSEKKLILCCVYILFGLALGAMVFNLLQDHIKRKLTSSSSCRSSGKKGKPGKRKSSTSGGYSSHHLNQNSQHSHLYTATGDRELLTSTPAPNNPLLVEDDFDV